ncbi:hypothetical protein QJQ45_005153 [Haematococcus lacustris]|nr:hypothetical protein QJQ45_005153 [Haematococcus lacustris]
MSWGWEASAAPSACQFQLGHPSLSAGCGIRHQAVPDEVGVSAEDLPHPLRNWSQQPDTQSKLVQLLGVQFSLRGGFFSLLDLHYIWNSKVVNGRKWVSRQHYHQERGEAVFLGAGNFSQGGWKAKAVRDGFRKVVEQPSRPSTDPRPDRLVIVDESSTSRVSSSVHARQPCELHLPDDRPRPEDCVPPAGQVNQRLLRPAWSLRHFKDVRGLKWCREVPPYPPPPAPPQHPPAPDPPPPAQHPPAQDPPAPAQDPPAPPPAQEPPPPAQDQPPAQAPPGPVPRPRAPSWGRWLDRDTNACLNFQRIGESMQRPLELCSYEGLKTLPPIGKEYQQGYKRVNDRLPKIRQRLHRAAEYRRGIDGRARNNADFPSSAACLYDTTTGQAIHAMDTVALQELQRAGHVIMHITDACALKANHLQAAVNEGLLPRRSKLVHHHARLGTRAAEVCAARAAIELDVQTLLRELMEQLHSAEALKLSQLASAQAEVLRELDSIDGLVAAVTAAAAALGGPSAFLDAAQPLAVECERLAAKAVPDEVGVSAEDLPHPLRNWSQQPDTQSKLVQLLGVKDQLIWQLLSQRNDLAAQLEAAQELRAQQVQALERQCSYLQAKLAEKHEVEAGRAADDRAHVDQGWPAS